MLRVMATISLLHHLHLPMLVVGLTRHPETDLVLAKAPISVKHPMKMVMVMR
jgi:hypothetical protein